jgi:uncharacterized protein
MAIDRRTFLGGAAALFAMPAPASAIAAEGSGPLYAASCKDAEGKHQAVVFSLDRGVLTAVPLPERGHDFALSPSSRDCVVFARRPGNFAAIFDPARQGPAQFITTRPDRHFYGHGAYSTDGKLLYATENDFGNSRGVIGIRDATDGYRWIGEFSTEGTGPHDLAILSDRRTLVIANGGIDTAPETGREMLNLADMRPSLAYIDLHSGELLEQYDLGADLAQLSIRHLAVAPDDTVIFGCQFEGPKTEQPPLVGFHRRGQAPQLISPPAPILRAMHNYVGAVTVDRTGAIAATSSPRGGIVVYWDVATRRYLGETRLPDACGISPTGLERQFLVTSGAGDMRLGPAGLTLPDPQTAERLRAFAWDNHAVLLEIPS